MESKELILRCVNCGGILREHDHVFQVRRYSKEHGTTYGPCCSFACAGEVQRNDIAQLENLLNLVRSQSFQIMEVKDYMDWNNT